MVLSLSTVELGSPYSAVHMCTLRAVLPYTRTVLQRYMHNLLSTVRVKYLFHTWGLGSKLPNEINLRIFFF